jgi:NAD kinase
VSRHTPDFTLPRVVLVTRRSPLEQLLAHHGTRSQARFYLESRHEGIESYEQAHARFEAGLAEVVRAIRPDQRRVRVDRDQLDRFLFAPDDLILIVGQDGLVPNVAKYLDGQKVAGINPDPERYDGVLCRHAPQAAGEILAWGSGAEQGGFRVEHRTMAVARREDGQELLALNEIFIGHTTHQSARYSIEARRSREHHSSSGVICSTGTGSTGWALSIARQRGIEEELPGPEEKRLSWFVREPFPSVSTQTELSFGMVSGAERLILHSEMGAGGVVFADGIEVDRLEFLSGHRVEVGVAETQLCLVVPARN